MHKWQHNISIKSGELFLMAIHVGDESLTLSFHRIRFCSKSRTRDWRGRPTFLPKPWRRQYSNLRLKCKHCYRASRLYNFVRIRIYFRSVLFFLFGRCPFIWSVICAGWPTNLGTEFSPSIFRYSTILDWLRLLYSEFRHQAIRPKYLSPNKTIMNKLGWDVWFLGSE